MVLLAEMARAWLSDSWGWRGSSGALLLGMGAGNAGYTLAGGLECERWAGLGTGLFLPICKSAYFAAALSAGVQILDAVVAIGKGDAEETLSDPCRVPGTKQPMRYVFLLSTKARVA